MAAGILRIQTFAVQRTAPVPGVTVVVTGNNFSRTLVTNSEGIAEDIEIEAPDCHYSLEEENTEVLPYAVCDIYATKEGYYPVAIGGNQIFSGQVTLAWLEMSPAEDGVATIEDDMVQIPAHPLFVGGGGSGPAPIDDGLDPRVLTEVVIPKNITVHLGKPAASAKNVTVSFRDYIANVASSEVYPTWGKQYNLINPPKRATELEFFWNFLRFRRGIA